MTSETMQRVAVALVSALAGGVLTYTVKALTIEGRLDGIERAVQRIEQRVYQLPGPPAPPHQPEQPAAR